MKIVFTVTQTNTNTQITLTNAPPFKDGLHLSWASPIALTNKIGGKLKKNLPHAYFLCDAPSKCPPACLSFLVTLKTVHPLTISVSCEIFLFVLK